MDQISLFRPYNNLRLRPLRPRQEKCIAEIREAIKEGHKRIIVAAPCGFGKTLTSAHLIGGAIEKGKRPVFTAPAISLIDQTVKAFEREGIRDIGVMQAQHIRTDREAQVQVASVQTLIKRAVPDADFLILDEAHIQYEGLNKLLDTVWKDKIAIGLTATPWAKGMGIRWTKMIIPATIADLIEEGFLTATRLYIPEQTANRSEIETSKGEFTEASASAQMRQSRIVGNVVETWKKYGPGEKTFMFCVDRASAKEQMAAFIDSGIPFGYIDALTPPDERTRQFTQMRNGEIAGIASVGCLIAGVDEDVRCIDAETEILTPQGWKGVGDSFQEVVSLNRKTGRLENVPVLNRTEYKRKGYMVAIHSGQYDLRVTDTHQMLVGTGRKARPMEFRDAGELLHIERFRLPISADSVAPGISLTDAQLRFIAWFQTDGTWHHNRTTVCIAQAKEEGKKRIREMLQANGFVWSESTAPNRGFGNNALPLTRFSVPLGVRQKRSIGKGWDGLQPYLDKDGSVKLLGMSHRQFGIFWEELLWGDGDNQKARVGRSPKLCVCNPSFLGFLQAAAAIAGYASNATIAAHLPSGKTAWNLGISERKFLEVKTRQKLRDGGYAVRESETTELVWCVQNVNRTIVVRRRGSVSIVGNCIIDANPTKSEISLVQRWGRGIRTAEGKEFLIGLDHAGNNAEDGLGLFWEIFHDHLDAHKPHEKGVAYEGEKRPSKPKRCTACHTLIPRGSAVCPNCGQPMRSVGVEHEEGELVVYGTQPKAKKTAGREYTVEEKKQWYGGMLWICRERGQSDGLAWHTFNDKFGHHPAGYAKTPVPPTPEVEMWDRHRRIKWAKSQARKQA